MKRNVITIACAAVVVAAIVVPLGVGGAPAPETAVLPQATQDADVAATAESAEGVGANAGAGADASGDAAEAGAETSADADDTDAYEKGVILVGLQDGVTAADLNARLAQLDYIATKQVADDDIALGYTELALADGIDVKGAENRIAADASDVVAAAQPNYRYHIADEAATPASAAAAAAQSDSLISGIIAQATEIDDTYKNQQWALDAVKAYDAWDTVKAGDAGDNRVTVAVIDTGIKTNHEDLKDRIVGAHNVVETINRFGRWTLDEANVEDGNGHGTHVAGIIAATANNNKGIAGVSFNANIMPIRVLDDEGEGNTLDLITGLAYVCDNAGNFNVKVANLSLGGDPDESDDALLAAIAEAHDKGILMVYAAGNDAEENHGAYINSPSDLDTNPGAIGVISLEKKSDESIVRSDFSNYNMTGQATKDLSAPGSNILSTAIKGMSTKDITYHSGTTDYGYMSGTSMAAPCVAGVAALAFAANPNLTAAQVRNVLCNTADSSIGSAGWDSQTGHGLIDASAAVRAAKSGTKTTASLASAKVSLDQARYTYTGSAIKPKVTVELDGATLSEGDDYTLGYSNNVNVGTGNLTVTGKGAYTGNVSATFPIVARSATPTVVLSATSYVWNGLGKTPHATVKVGGTTLAASNYTLTYASGRTDVGSYAVTATLKGNYSGTGRATFTIIPPATKLTKVKAAKKGFTVKWRKQAVQTSGYQIQYSLKKNFASKTKTVTVGKVKTVKKAVKKLKAKKRYYVRVRTFKSVGGVRYYSDWSAQKSVKTKA